MNVGYQHFPYKSREKKLSYSHLVSYSVISSSFFLQIISIAQKWSLGTEVMSTNHLGME